MKEVYQILAGSLGQEQRLAQIANNLANVNTTGFKKDGTAFQDYLKAASLTPGGDPSGPTASPSGTVFPTLGRAYTDFSMGSMQITERPLDLAIEGDGFFQVLTEDGAARFTRAGNFLLDAEGKLVTPEGYAVLNRDSRSITLDPRLGTPQVAGDGTIYVGGQSVSQVGVFQFDPPQPVSKAGASLFAAPAGVEPVRVEQPAVRSGALEGSNVNAITEMIGMIEAQRAYEVNQKMIQTIDDLTRQRIVAAS